MGLESSGKTSTLRRFPSLRTYTCPPSSSNYRGGVQTGQGWVFFFTGLLQRHGFRQEDRGGVDQFSFDFPSDESEGTRPNPQAVRDGSWTRQTSPVLGKHQGLTLDLQRKRAISQKQQKKFRGGPRKARDSDCIRCKSVDGGATNQDRHE